MFPNTMSPVGSTANQIINTYNLITNSGSTPLSFERPTPKSHKIVKAKTCFEILAEYEKYNIERCVKPSQLKNVRQTIQILTRLLHFMGFLDLSELDREGAEQIANAYRYRPKNPDKHPELKGLQGFELIFKNKSLKHPIQHIALTTALGHLEKMSTFLNWAKTRRYVTDNVFYKLTLKKSNKDKAKSVFPFSGKQLSAIFSMSDYTRHKYLHSYYYWLPILMRYTGARMNELCQLRIVDIILIKGIYCIWIHEGSDDQTVKSGKMRLIPLHDEILAKGFIEFVNTRPGVRLFPELRMVNGYYSNNASKWFARRREKLGSDFDSSVNGHSFRRSFINELKQNLVAKNLVENIAGHVHQESDLKELTDDIVRCFTGEKHNSESFDTYAQQYCPSILAPLINVIDSSHTAHILPYFSKKEKI